LHTYANAAGKQESCAALNIPRWLNFCASQSLVFVASLATDYCDLVTVKDARTQGFEVWVLIEAVRAMDTTAGDGKRALG
jgi:hypothetical protein